MESTARNEHGDLKTFFGVLVLRTPTVEIVVKPSSIYFNGASLSWDDKAVFRMENVAIIVKYVGRHDRTMMIDFGNDVIVSIRRHMKQDTNMAMSYLNIYIEKETGISQFASGVLGEELYRIVITKLYYHVGILYVAVFFSLSQMQIFLFHISIRQIFYIFYFYKSFVLLGVKRLR